MPYPSVDLEKGIAGLNEEEKDIAGLKEEEKAVYQLKHLKVMCVKRLLDVVPLLYFAGVMLMAFSLYRQYHVWWPAPVLLSFAIINFCFYRRMKHVYIQRTLASADSDLSTTLLASSSKK